MEKVNKIEKFRVRVLEDYGIKVDQFQAPAVFSSKLALLRHFSIVFTRLSAHLF